MTFDLPWHHLVGAETRVCKHWSYDKFHGPQYGGMRSSPSPRYCCSVNVDSSLPPFLSLPPLLPSQAVDIRHIADKFPEKNGGLKDLFEKGPQDRFFLVKFWVRSLYWYWLWRAQNLLHDIWNTFVLYRRTLILYCWMNPMLSMASPHSKCVSRVHKNGRLE